MHHMALLPLDLAPARTPPLQCGCSLVLGSYSSDSPSFPCPLTYSLTSLLRFGRWTGRAVISPGCLKAGEGSWSQQAGERGLEYVPDPKQLGR